MIGQEAGKSYAYLLGVYMGDGCVTRYERNGTFYPVFRLNTIDHDFMDATKSAIEKLTDYKVSTCVHEVSKSSKPNHALRCADAELCRRLVSDTDKKTRLPSLESLEDKLAFIVGLMDSEGFVSKKSGSEDTYYMGFKCCDNWVYDFVALLQSVGVQIGKVSVCPPYKEGYKTPVRFHIKMDSWVKAGLRFSIARKQHRVDVWAAARGLSYN